MSNSQKFTYFITGGGTGGHIYPAIAVADVLLTDDTTKDLYYIGNPNNLEYDIVRQKNIKFLGVNVHGMPRKLNLALVKWTLQLAIACIKCVFYILKYKPDVIFGTGGYVSAPGLIAAKILNKPYMMHDCDAQPGLVTKSLSRGAKLVSLAFECAKNCIPNKNCIINGNPIRAKFKTLSKEDARKTMGLENKLTICVMGGSQGAMSINNATVAILKKLSEHNIQVIFQTGKKNFERVIEQLLKIYPEYANDKNILVKPYFDDMVTVLKASDIAVSRSGSLSLSEIEAAGLASILVPYPYAAADHQRKNARFMVEQGASIYLEDAETTEKTLSELLFSLIDDNAKLETLQNNALALAKYDAATEIVNELKTLI